jgi:hypothetical protein
MEPLPRDVWRHILSYKNDEHSYEWLLSLGYVCHNFYDLLQATPQLFWWKRPRRVRLLPQDLSPNNVEIHIVCAKPLHNEMLNALSTSHYHWRSYSHVVFNRALIGEARYDADVMEASYRHARRLFVEATRIDNEAYSEANVFVINDM